MKKRLLSVVLCLAIMLSCSSVALAATFSDVNAAKLSWAVNEIELMASQGIITGYSDGTFKPEKSVTKLESLLLISRILGVNDSKYSEICDIALDTYAADLDLYDINYKKEIAFLLHKGFFDVSELDSYIGATTKNAPLKRYEAAVLITKTLGGEGNIAFAPATNFTDASYIPASAKQYVNYVYSKGVMQGVSSTEFSPQTEVNRAQMAVMLKKSMDCIDYTVTEGKIISIIASTKTVTIVNGDGKLKFQVSDDTVVKYNGVATNYYKLPLGCQVIITESDDAILSIDAFNADFEEEVAGIVKGTEFSKDLKIGAYDAYDGPESLNTYQLSDDCVIIDGGDVLELSDIDPGSFVKLKLNDGLVSYIEVADETETFKGTIAEVKVDTKVSVVLKTQDDEILTFSTYDDVEVTKNSKKFTIKDVYSGESATLTTENGYITKIAIVTKSVTDTGAIEELVISKNPKITIKNGDVVTTYNIASDVDVLVNGIEATIYDLRLSHNVTITGTSGVATKIETTEASESTVVTGEVVVVNANYGFISVNYTEGSVEKTTQVFVQKGTSIVNASGDTVKLASIKAGNKVSCTGVSTNGAFEAIIIVVW